MTKTISRSGTPAIAAILAIHLAATSAEAQVQRVGTVAAATAAKQTVMPKDPVVKTADVGPVSTATGLPLADLIIKDAYLDDYNGFPFANFQIANIGQKDAGPFEVSIRFIYKPESEIGSRMEIYPVDSLKAGESTWISASPLCCGWAGTEMVVNNTYQFEVIADPKYSKWDPMAPYDPSRIIEVKSRIPESNKGNNKFAIYKSDMKRGKLGGMVMKPGAPSIGNVKPQTPITKH